MQTGKTGFNFFVCETSFVDNTCIFCPVQTQSGGTNWFEDIQQVSLGKYHSASIKTDGTLWTWGCNLLGQLGDNSNTNQSSPVQTVSTGTNWKQVSLGLSCHSSAIKTDGTLWLWGWGTQGQLGNFYNTSQTSPVQTVSQGNNWKQVSGGFNFSAAVKIDGTLWLWGYGGAGKLGNYSTTRQSSPVQTVSTGTNWKQVSLGCLHSVAIKTDGTLWTWGFGGCGRLGNNSVTAQSSPVQTISSGTNWRQTALGGENSAAVKTDGTLWLWGWNNGRLGTNSTIDQSSPVQTVSTGTNWKQVSLGEYHSSALKTDGTLWSWGCGNSGILGSNSSTTQSSPVQTVSTGTNWKQVSVGYCHTAATKTDGTLWLWGCNYDGRLGANSVSTQSSPVQTVSSGTEWTEECAWCSFSVSYFSSVAIKTDGTLWTWGASNFGRLGNNSTITRSSPVQTVSTGTNWKQVSASSTHTAAIKTDGTLWMWGYGNYGKLGNNSTITRSSPVQTVSTSTNWKQVSAGIHTAAIKTDGTLWLWGYNRCGILGNYSTISQSSPVQTVSTGTNWKQVSGGIVHVGAVKTDGTLWLWGSGTVGRLGTYSTIGQSSPVQTVSTGTNWKQVSISDGHSAAIKTDGTLWLWGCNLGGRLGANSSITHSSPVQTVSTGTNWKQVSVGQLSAALKTDGTLWLWGCNCDGRLGTNSTINQSSPVQTVSTGTNWKQVSCSFALSENNELYVWGLNFNGQLNIPPIDCFCTCRKAEFDDFYVRKDLFSEGGLWGWGNNSVGQIGTNDTLGTSSPVQTLSRGTNWSQVSAADFDTAAIKTDGTLWLWGRNSDGRLGTYSTTNASSPVQTVSTGTNWKQVSVGNYHSGAIKTDGTLWLWGSGSCGILGNLCNLINRSSPVQTVSTGTNWKQVSLSRAHSAALKTDGTLWLWGDNFYGQLGTNTILKRSSPIQTVSTGTNWKQVSVALYNSAAIKTDGTLWVWGSGKCGRLGTNSTINQSSPVQTVSTGTNWKQVSVARSHIASIKTDGTLWLWGQNYSGKLGNNDTVHYSSPIQTVSTGNNWKQVSVSYCQSIAIKTDGTLWVWGYNSTGRLGTNSTILQSSPVQTVSTGTNWKQVSAGYHTFAIREDCW